MSKFETFRNALKDNFDKMSADAQKMFVVDIDGDELYEFYLDSFPSGENDIYRKKREYDCSACRRFIKDIGAAVTIKDGVVKSIWDFQTGNPSTQKVCDKISKLIYSRPIKGVYVARERLVGVPSNKELVNDHVVTWRHFYVDVPVGYVKRHYETIDGIKGNARAAMMNLKSSLDIFNVEDIETVLELINDGVVYRGDQWVKALSDFLKMKREYDALGDDEKDVYVWEKSISTSADKSLKNTSIGTLILDIHNGDDIEVALRKYENVTAPANYKRPKAVFTKKMLEDAKKTITELGYLDSLRRRFANIDDITVNDVIYADGDTTTRMSDDSDDIFAEMAKTATKKGNPKKYDNAQEITIEKFIKDVVPTATSIELLFEPRLEKNLVSLIAPVDKDAPSMFKWSNGFSWAYKGNVADSMIRQNVKSAGGNVDGYLRFSIQWNDTDPTVNSDNDLDAHCRISDLAGRTIYHIFYADKCDHYKTHGRLDVDRTHTHIGVPAVENIYWTKERDVRGHKFNFYVNQFSYRGGNDGFRAQLEINGEVFDYNYPCKVLQSESIKVVDVTVNNDGSYTIKHYLDDNKLSRQIWGIDTNEFVPVTSIMYSPNYWGDNKTGNKHYIFGVGGCINDENPNAWYNEYLRDELVKNHKRVMEALGSKAHVEDADDQISGFGFSSTLREKFTVRVKGATERIMKVVV